jgi:hypothetical protein
MHNKHMIGYSWSCIVATNQSANISFHLWKLENRIFKTVKRQWNIPITESWLDDMENNRIFKTMKRQWNIPITESWLDDMENNRIFKTMKRQWNIPITWSWLDDMENSGILKTMKRQWNIPITGSWLDDMENSGILKTMKRQWKIPITESWLDGTFVQTIERSKRTLEYWKYQMFQPTLFWSGFLRYGWGLGVLLKEFPGLLLWRFSLSAKTELNKNQLN